MFSKLERAIYFTNDHNLELQREVLSFTFLYFSTNIVLSFCTRLKIVPGFLNFLICVFFFFDEEKYSESELGVIPSLLNPVATVIISNIWL